MSKGRSHKGQHFIPSSYLSAWTDPNTPSGQTPYVWLFPNGGGEGRRKAPENIFKETDLYTIPMPDGSRDLRLEHGLQQLEGGIKTLRREYIEARKQIPLVRFMKLMAFTSALKHRTPAVRDHHRKEWGRILKVGEDLEAHMASKTPEERNRAVRSQLPRDPKNPSMSLNDVRKIIEQPIQIFLPAAMRMELPILTQMQSIFLMAPTGSEFITSDNPVVRYDPDMYKRPLMFRSPDLRFPNVEVTIPLSPRTLLLITHGQTPAPGIKPVAYVDVQASYVEAFNCRTADYSREYLVTSANKINPAWTVMREVADDVEGTPGAGV